MVIQSVKYILSIMLFTYVAYCCYPLFNPAISKGELENADVFVRELVDGKYDKPLVRSGDLTDVKSAIVIGYKFDLMKEVLVRNSFRVFPDTTYFVVEAKLKDDSKGAPILSIGVILFLDTYYIFHVGVLR